MTISIGIGINSTSDEYENILCNIARDRVHPDQTYNDSNGPFKKRS